MTSGPSVREQNRELVALAISWASLPHRLTAPLWAQMCEALQLEPISTLLPRLIDENYLEKVGSELVLQPKAGSRDIIQAQLSLTDPLRWHKAHRLCAQYYRMRGNDGDLLSAVIHYLAVDDRVSAQTLLEQWGSGALDGRFVHSVLPALNLLTQGDAPVSWYIYYLQARTLERNGQIAAAIESMESAIRSAQPSSNRDGKTSIITGPTIGQMCAQVGLLALRVGQTQKAEMWLNEARQWREPQLALVEQLSARLSLANGDLGFATKAFLRAAKMAAINRDTDEEARAYSGLGVIAMRKGEPLLAAEQYRRAQKCGARHSPLVAQIEANLAMSLSLTGHFAEAVELFSNVAAMRERLGDLAGTANSLAACAMAREGNGDIDAARNDLARAKHIASMVQDPALLLEIHLIRSNLAARTFDVPAARVGLIEAKQLAQSIEGLDPLLSAMIEETTAEIALAQSNYSHCAQSARQALTILKKQGAQYLYARVLLLLARNAFSANCQRMAFQYLFAAARISTKPKYGFSNSWVCAPLFAFGAKSNNELVSSFCGVTKNSPAAVNNPRIIPAGSGPFRIIDRNGVRLATIQEVERIRRNPPMLLLDLPEQLLVSNQKRNTLNGRKILVPLLLLFLQRPNQSHTGEQLHHEIWGTDRLDQPANNRMKVSLSRLRTLVGKGVIETRRETDSSGVVRTLFYLAADLSYAVIERSLTDNSAHDSL